MKADSRIFGQIEIEDDKIITLEKGMIGFPDLNHFALIYDEEKEKKYNSIMRHHNRKCNVRIIHRLQPHNGIVFFFFLFIINQCKMIEIRKTHIFL